MTLTESSALNPNGWAEFSDMSVLYGCDDGTLKEEHALMKWDRLFMEACDKLGTEHSPGPKLDAWVRQQPYRNVRSYHFKIPLGPWAKDPHNQDLGWNNLAQTIDGLDAFTLKLFIGVLGWTREEVIVLLAQVRKELKSRPFAFHAYIDWYVFLKSRLVFFRAKKVHSGTLFTDKRWLPRKIDHLAALCPSMAVPSRHLRL